MNKIILILLFLNIAVWWHIGATLDSIFSPTKIYFLNVGQGDASFIKTISGNILIDAGRGRKTLQELGKIYQIGDRTIDILVITHPQLDHIGAIPELFKRYKIRLVMLSGVSYESKIYESILDWIIKNKIPVVYAVSGQEIITGKGKWKIINPEDLLIKNIVSPKEINDTSIVMRYDEGDVSVLFTGDISEKKEKKIKSKIGNINILKVAHHGSKYSSSIEFLRAMKPELAIISVGKNPYGHPAKETIERLNAIGAKILRTDLNGTITIEINNNSYKLSNL
jgi:competence protein ComEC